MFSNQASVSVQCSSDDDDDFIPKKERPSVPCSVPRTVEVTDENGSRNRKKPLIRLKKGDATLMLTSAQEKSINTEDFAKVHDVLPSCCSYLVTGCKSLEESKWSAVVRAEISNRSEAENWLSEFEKQNSMDFRFWKSKKVEGSERLEFKRQYRCHHNTMPRISTGNGVKSSNFKSKNTDCPAFIRITIKQRSMKWSSDYLLQTYPCEIIISHTHNHPIVCANALRRRRPSKAILEKFTNLLQKGYMPLAALECHKFDLQTEYGDDYYKVAADQALCPSNFWVYKLFKRLNIKQYGPQTGDQLIESLKKFCDGYNEDSKMECVKTVTVDGVHLVVAVCTPLMKRASTLLKSAGEIMFADSSGTMDSLNCKLFLLQTSSAVGGIPIGALIVTSESERVLNVALELWKSLLPENAFYGKGPKVGPEIIMTDDCTSERNALQSAFLAAILLLCLFHTLQAFWRFVWSGEHQVAKTDRGGAFFLFRDIVYAESEESFSERLDYARTSDVMKRNPKVLDHLEKQIPRAREWALCYRKHLLIRGHNTNNISEAGMRIFKDKVLNRSKAFNPVHLLEFVVTRYDNYLKGRIIDVVNNRAPNAFKSRFYTKPEKIQELTCSRLEPSPNTFLVKNTSKGTEYTVVADLELCSCPAGSSGAPCKHLSAVVQKFGLTSSLVHPLLQCENASLKMILFEVAHGHQNVPTDWFADLVHGPCHMENNQQDGPSDAANMIIVADSGLPHLDNPTMVNDIVDENSLPCVEEDLKSIDDSLDSILSEYKERMRGSRDFLSAVKVFIKQNEKLNHSETGLVSALHTFGKASGPLPLSLKNKRAGSVIPVQPGSKARRTVYLGGKRAQFTGRPPKP